MSSRFDIQDRIDRIMDEVDRIKSDAENLGVNSRMTSIFVDEVEKGVAVMERAIGPSYGTSYDS